MKATFLALLLATCLPAPAAITNDDPADLTITAALFGSGASVADVTKRVTELLASEPAGFTARADWLHVDPLPYKPKALAIAYDYHGAHHLCVVTGGDRVSRKLLLENAKR